MMAANFPMKGKFVAIVIYLFKVFIFPGVLTFARDWSVGQLVSLKYTLLHNSKSWHTLEYFKKCLSRLRVWNFSVYLHLQSSTGALAHLARALDWQSKGDEFESRMLHMDKKH